MYVCPTLYSVCRERISSPMHQKAEVRKQKNAKAMQQRRAAKANKKAAAYCNDQPADIAMANPTMAETIAEQDRTPQAPDLMEVKFLPMGAVCLYLHCFHLALTSTVYACPVMYVCPMLYSVWLVVLILSAHGKPLTAHAVYDSMVN
jgi:hypothetical protein